MTTIFISLKISFSVSFSVSLQFKMVNIFTTRHAGTNTARAINRWWISEDAELTPGFRSVFFAAGSSHRTNHIKAFRFVWGFFGVVSARR